MTWLQHVKKVMSEEKDKKKTMGKKWFSHVLKTAKKSYKKHKKGGAEPAPENAVSAPAPVAGGRRKTRRHRKQH